MKTNTISARKHSALIGMLATMSFIASMGLGLNQAHAAITSQMGIGSKGPDVTQLQQFLATNSDIYPQGIVSGYFGALTQAAVVQFQVAYDIEQVGHVGPITRAKINSVMASGLGLDTTVPVMSTPVTQVNRTTASVSWTASEPVQSQVYYDTLPIQSNEATAHFQQPYVSGTLASDGSHTTQNLTLQNLQSNTLYYYLTRSIDASGNLTMTMPKTFVTTQ